MLCPQQITYLNLLLSAVFAVKGLPYAEKSWLMF